MNTQLKVLIIEDSETDTLLLLRELRRGGYDPVFERIETREELVNAFTNKIWDIVISDYTMPRFNGLEALKLLRQNGLDVPFISVSGTIGEDTAVEAMKAGANDYIMKGNLKRLVPAINRELRETKIKLERKEAEQALRESEAKYRTLVERINEGVFQSDLEGNYITLNKAGARILGFDFPEEVIGEHKTTDFFNNFDDQSKITEDIKRTGLSMREVQIKKRDGTLIWILNNKHAILDEKGNIIGIGGVFSDITERKKAVEERINNTSKMITAMEATIEAMARTMELRDAYTSGHQLRVTRLAVAIAQEMGLQEDKISGVRLASIVHDIGKISIPAEILTKPGKLNKLEFNLIKEHPQAGYEILKNIAFPWPISKIVLQHHERMNGSGYPEGLSAEAIIPEARILAVADVVEAMASHRPYRPALGIDKALEEISSNKGVLYDTNAVDACLSLFSKQRFKFE